jgi:Tol biopolymer transport system component
MELVAGSTLADRVAQGAMPVPEALAIARQIADALDAAHEKGIIHRDLKPANIKVAPDGIVKVLDFGLAKAVVPDASIDATNSPTFTVAATQLGVIVGTAAYMAPEQARGKVVDKRADIWAFGCVLYETLTGQPAFAGETVTDIIASVVQREPDWAKLPGDTPRSVRRLLGLCLQKDPRQRLRDIGDARLGLTDTAPSEPTAAIQIARRSPLALAVAAIAGATVAAASAAVIISLRASAPPALTPVGRFRTVPASGEHLSDVDRPSLALSPDGRYLAYIANRGGRNQIYIRRMDSLEGTPLQGTEDASSLFFSPDGRWIGFWAGGQLKKTSVDGKTPAAIANAPNLFGAAWTPDDRILFVPLFDSPIMGIPAAGGSPQPVTTLNQSGADPEVSHHWPDLLPDGQTLIFEVGLKSHRAWDDALIVAQSLKTGQRNVIVRGGAYARYLPTGHVAFVRGRTLFAVPFDQKTLQTTGPPVPLIEGITLTQLAVAQFAVSRDWFVYVPDDGPGSTVVATARDGSTRSLFSTTEPFVHPRVSPDGSRIAVRKAGFNCDLWIVDVGRGTTTRLTFEGDNHAPVWSPDGRAIFYGSDRGEPLLMRKPTDGSTNEEIVLRINKSTVLDGAVVPQAISPDGRLLIFVTTQRSTKTDIWYVNVDPPRVPKAFAATTFTEEAPTLSPDGHWLAYVSDESGRSEVYVQRFPDGGGKWPVSNDGGTEPRWSPDGREIYYRAGANMMAASVDTRDGFGTARPVSLFNAEWIPSLRLTGMLPGNYDMHPKSGEFVVIRRDSAARGANELRVIANWREELKPNATRP